MTKRDKLRKQKACKHENYEYTSTGTHERFYDGVSPFCDISRQ